MAPTHGQAVALAVTSYTCWVLVDASLKLAGASALPTAEVVALLGMFGASFMAAWCIAHGRAATLWPHRPGRQMARALLDVGNNFCVVIALRHLPLSLFYVLVFSSPMVTTLLAAGWLGERLEPRKVIAIVVGFAGVVLAVMPLGRGEWQGYLACLVCVLCFSTSIVWSRRMTQSETRESLTFFSGLVTMCAGVAGMAFGVAPVTGRLLALLAAAGLFGVVGSLCFFGALKYASAATVAQYHYSQLVAGSLLAYLIWHEKPGLAMAAGAALIIGAGIYTARAGMPAKDESAGNDKAKADPLRG